MHTRNHHQAPTLCASVALVAASSSLATIAANAMHARALLDDQPGEPSTMRTHHVLLAGHDLPHHLFATAMRHQPGRDLVLVDSTFDNGAMTMFESDDPGCDPASMLMSDLLHERNRGDLHHDQGRDATMLMTGGRHNDLGFGAIMMIGGQHDHPDLDALAMMDGTVHDDQGALDHNDGGGSSGINPGMQRLHGTLHLHDLRTDRRDQPQNRGRHHDAGDLPVMMCIGAERQQHHATPPDARLLN